MSLLRLHVYKNKKVSITWHTLCVIKTMIVCKDINLFEVSLKLTCMNVL